MGYNSVADIIGLSLLFV